MTTPVLCVVPHLLASFSLRFSVFCSSLFLSRSVLKKHKETHSHPDVLLIIEMVLFLLKGIFFSPFLLSFSMSLFPTEKQSLNEIKWLTIRHFPPQIFQAKTRLAKPLKPDSHVLCARSNFSFQNRRRGEGWSNTLENCDF